MVLTTQLASAGPSGAALGSRQLARTLEQTKVVNAGDGDHLGAELSKVVSRAATPFQQEQGGVVMGDLASGALERVGKPSHRLLTGPPSCATFSRRSIRRLSPNRSPPARCSSVIPS